MSAVVNGPDGRTDRNRRRGGGQAFYSNINDRNFRINNQWHKIRFFMFISSSADTETKDDNMDWGVCQQVQPINSSIYANFFDFLRRFRSFSFRRRRGNLLTILLFGTWYHMLCVSTKRRRWSWQLDCNLKHVRGILKWANETYSQLYGNIDGMGRSIPRHLVSGWRKSSQDQFKCQGVSLLGVHVSQPLSS